jgi:hypothetical protein
MVRIMAELDYAFIAEFAKVENGKLTAVGASYIDVRPGILPTQQLLAVAGRVRAPEDVEVIGLRIRINPPGNAMNIIVTGELRPGPETVRYDGKLGVLFALSAPVTLTTEGLCEIFIDVDEVEQRRLAFRVIAPQ